MRDITITWFIVGVLVIGFILAGWGVYMVDLEKNYGVDASQINTTAYNKLKVMAQDVDSIKTNISAISGKDATLFDIIGNLVSSGVSTARTVIGSFSLGNALFAQSVEDANIGTSGALTTMLVWSLISVLLFVGVILAAIIKWRL